MLIGRASHGRISASVAASAAAGPTPLVSRPAIGDNPRVRVLALALALAPRLACAGDDAATSITTAGTRAAENPDPHATFVAHVDLLDLCGPIGATNVFLRATRVACAGGPLPPCTVPSNPYEVFVGDTAGCPNSQTSAVMRVEVPRSGRYSVEAVTVTESGSLALCYGVGGSDPVEVIDADLDARAEIPVDPRSGPCPDP